MASPHPFHEQRDAVSDTAPGFFKPLRPPPSAPQPSGPTPAPVRAPALGPYARPPLAASLDSMARMVS